MGRIACEKNPADMESFHYTDVRSVEDAAVSVQVAAIEVLVSPRVATHFPRGGAFCPAVPLIHEEEMANHWFALYPGDYQRDTGDLTLVEHGVYLKLILHYYNTRKPLPDDPKSSVVYVEQSLVKK